MQAPPRQNWPCPSPHAQPLHAPHGPRAAPGLYPHALWRGRGGCRCRGPVGWGGSFPPRTPNSKTCVWDVNLPPPPRAWDTSSMPSPSHPRPPSGLYRAPPHHTHTAVSRLVCGGGLCCGCGWPRPFPTPTKQAMHTLMMPPLTPHSTITITGSSSVPSRATTRTSSPPPPPPPQAPPNNHVGQRQHPGLRGRHPPLRQGLWLLRLGANGVHVLQVLQGHGRGDPCLH